MSLALTTGKRKIKDGSKYNQYFPSETEAYGNDTVLKRAGSVFDTVQFIADIIENDKADTAQISPILEGATRLETLENIHQFMIDHLQYDVEKGEKLRSPRRTWWVGSKQNDKETGNTGVDCDDMVIFSGTILRNLNIPYYIRIVKIDGDEFQHVYLVVPTTGNTLSGAYITLDGVISKFNYEYPFKTQNTYDMSGNKMKIEYLGNVPGNDPVLDFLISKHRAIALKKVLLRKANSEDIKGMLNHVISKWNNPHDRVVALRQLADAESKYYPGQRFFNVLKYYIEQGRMPALDFPPFKGGNTPPDPVITPDMHMESVGVTDVTVDEPPPMSGMGDITDWDDIPVEDYQDDIDGGGNGTGAAIALGILAALANFDWSLVGGNPQQPPQTLPPQTQPINTTPTIAGLSLTTIGGVLLAGGLVYMVAQNIKAAKSNKK